MNFDQICRLCCVEKGSLRQILENSTLADIFSNVLQIVVYADDHLPQNVCEECTATMVNLHETIEYFRQNDHRLRQQLVQGYEVKDEVLLSEPEECLMEPETQTCQLEEAKVEPELEGDGFLEETVEEIEREVVAKPKKRRQRSKRNSDESGNKIPELSQKRNSKRDPNLPRTNDHKCYVCKSDSLGSGEALLEHLNVNHADEVPHTCPLCVHETVTVKNVTSLNVHKRMHAMPVQCPHCDMRVVNKGILNTHIKIKHCVDPQPSRCEQCDKLFPSKMALKIHAQKHILAYSCEFCGKRFNGPSKMNLHIQRMHSQANKVKCHICQKELNCLDALQRHIEIMHSSVQFPCSQCSKIYTSESTLRQHEKKHAEVPNFNARMKSNIRSYYTLVESADGGPPKKKCNQCDLVVSNISMHLKYKHFPRATYPCEQCEREFRDIKSLSVHKLEHTVGKFLKCPICDREFNERRNLLSHLKTKQHRDHPLAQRLDWLDAMYPAGRTPVGEGPVKVVIDVAFGDDLVKDEDRS
uniref:Zinc finger protein 714 n=1 Tax=Culex pipiens TaxID=7175 RepID=A0A8D8BHP4_CULPI